MTENMRIDWMQGMEIIPATLIAADNYHLFHHDLNRKLLSQQVYGLIPRIKFDINCSISNNLLQIQEIHCDAITRNGQVIQLHGKYTVTLPPSSMGEFYLVVKTQGSTHVEINEIPYTDVNYNLEFKPWAELADGNIFPVIKIRKEGDYWQTVDYIPPCFTISSCRMLIGKYEEMKKIVKEIHGHFLNLHYADYLEYSFSLLLSELNFMTKNETPYVFLLLIRKIVGTFFACEQDLINEGDNFIKNDYDHNDLQIMLDQASILLNKFLEILIEKGKGTPLPEPPEQEEWVPQI